MASMWEQTAEMAKRHEKAGDIWLALANDGDKAVVVFLGEPYPREVVFLDGRYVLVDEKLKAQGHKASLRVTFNVALYDTREVKVTEKPIAFFNSLLEVRAKYGLEKWAFEVKRHGAAKDPKTTYSILPERQLTPEEQEAFKALRQHDLAKLYAEEADGGTGGGGASLSGFSPKATEALDPKLAQAMTATLKALPREAVDRFLQKFNVKRIRDVPASRAEEARVFVDTLVAGYAAFESTAEVDPFGP